MPRKPRKTGSAAGSRAVRVFRAVYWISRSGRHHIRLTEFKHARLSDSALLMAATTAAAYHNFDLDGGELVIGPWAGIP